jgi:hypothetical protein
MIKCLQFSNVTQLFLSIDASVNIPLRLSSKPLPQTLIVPKSLPEEQL